LIFETGRAVRVARKYALPLSKFGTFNLILTRTAYFRKHMNEGGIMEINHWEKCEEVKIDKFPYKGEKKEVVGVSVRWLSQYGEDGTGYPEYGLRYFTVQPGGQIPIHNHFYHQTMYILSGEFECWQFDSETDEKVKSRLTGPGDFVYVPSMEPHGMKNIGAEPATFLCCICNVYDEEM
jgi:quercetin dioxygenase-like cupin family protein